MNKGRRLDIVLYCAGPLFEVADVFNCRLIELKKSNQKYTI